MGQANNFDKCIEGSLHVGISSDIYDNIDNNLSLDNISQNLLAHWNFYEGEGQTLDDQSGNGYLATINNGASWSNDVPSSGEAEDLSLGTSYTLNDDLLDNTQYHWQVTAEDQSGATYSTPLQSFIVNVENDLPSDFALLSPNNESMVTELAPSFHWEEPTDLDFNGSVERYDFYLNTSNSFTGIDPIELTTNDYVYDNGLNEDQLYYWKVVAVDNDGGETVSECWSFYTNSENSAPSEFALLSPLK